MKICYEGQTVMERVMGQEADLLTILVWTDRKEFSYARCRMLWKYGGMLRRLCLRNPRMQRQQERRRRRNGDTDWD